MCKFRCTVLLREQLCEYGLLAGSCGKQVCNNLLSMYLAVHTKVDIYWIVSEAKHSICACRLCIHLFRQLRLTLQKTMQQGLLGA